MQAAPKQWMIGAFIICNSACQLLARQQLCWDVKGTSMCSRKPLLARLPNSPFSICMPVSQSCFRQLAFNAVMSPCVHAGAHKQTVRRTTVIWKVGRRYDLAAPAMQAICQHAASTESLFAKLITQKDCAFFPTRGNEQAFQDGFDTFDPGRPR